MNRLFILFVFCSPVKGIFQSHQECIINSKNPGRNPGTPLFLTPFVKSGKILEGREKARVPAEKWLGIQSYAGFFTVNHLYNSNQFFWYFPPMNTNKRAPVIVWLQGGPGLSSLFGLFKINGPFYIRNETVHIRDVHWAINHHVIYIDNPVGTGFSFTEDPRGYCTNQTQVGEELYSTLIQFFQLFPDLQENDFFITGESYAGKYVPALGYTIHKYNPEASVKINLKGMVFGNGFCDPINQLDYSTYLYQIGLLDWHAAKLVSDLEKEIVKHISKQNWNDAFKIFNLLVMEDKNLIFNLTGFSFQYNFLHSEDYTVSENYACFLENEDIRSYIHVGDLPYHNNTEVKRNLENDIMKSIATWISELLDHYEIMIYSGHLDMIIPYPFTVNVLRRLKFNGSAEYSTASRYKWKVNDELAGYFKKAGKLTEVMVRNAGHMMPIDQPKWAFDLISRFTHGVSLKEERIKLLWQIPI